MTQSWCSAVADGVRLSVQVMPNAKKSEVVSIIDDAIKIRLHAQPVEGKANSELVRFLADLLGVPKSRVAILRGQTGKRKIVEITGCGVTPESATRMLASASK